MLAVIPALSFMQGLVGAYTSIDRTATLHIEPCGYGQVLRLVDSGKVIWGGVVGASGETVECWSQLGLPNVFRMLGSMPTPKSIQFSDVPDGFFTATISRVEDGIDCSICLKERQVKAFRLSHIPAS